MYAGEPGFVLSPNCHFLRKAMNGAYHYDKDPKGSGEEYKPMPVKNFASHVCLAGDTLVKMRHGEKRIDEIAVGDKVITPYGIRKVLASGLTKKEVHVLEIVLSDGTKIKCTENHEFILPNKSIAKCNSLQYNDVLQNYNSWRILKWSIQKLLSTRGKSIGFRQEIITGQKTGTAKVLAIFTGLFGNFIINAKSLVGMISTTLTTIRSIMIFPILNLFIIPTTEDTILKNELPKGLLIMSNLLNLQEKQPKHGTLQKRVLNGIQNTEKKAGRTEKFTQLAANIVGNNFKRHFRVEKNSVTSIAKPEQDTIAEKTTFKERVLFVVQTLWRINILSLKPALRIVRISQRLKTENVYNITVDTDHVFYANGILTCNCDALEYLCMYATENENLDRERKNFLAQLNQREYRPASYEVGY